MSTVLGIDEAAFLLQAGKKKGVESKHRMSGSNATDEILYRYCFQSNYLPCSLPIYVHQASIIKPKRSRGIWGFSGGPC
jgi:hypothetical protein